MTEDEEMTAHGERLQALGSIQARYGWWLLLVGLFALALHVQLVDCGLFTEAAGVEACSEPVLAPLLGIEISPLVLWAASPAIIALLTLAMLGAINAAAEVLASSGRLTEWGGSPDGYVDTKPNAIDLAFFVHPAFGRSSSHAWLQRAGKGLRWVSRRRYTLVVTLLGAEAAVISRESFKVAAATEHSFLGHDVLNQLGVLFLMFVLVRLVYMLRLSMAPVEIQDDAAGL